MHTGFWGSELPTSHTELAGKCLTPETFLQSLKQYLFIYLVSKNQSEKDSSFCHLRSWQERADRHFLLLINHPVCEFTGCCCLSNKDREPSEFSDKDMTAVEGPFESRLLRNSKHACSTIYVSRPFSSSPFSFLAIPHFDVTEKETKPGGTSL